MNTLNKKTLFEYDLSNLTVLKQQILLDIQELDALVVLRNTGEIEVYLEKVFSFFSEVEKISLLFTVQKDRGLFDNDKEKHLEIQKFFTKKYYPIKKKILQRIRDIDNNLLSENYKRVVGSISMSSEGDMQYERREEQIEAASIELGDFSSLTKLREARESTEPETSYCELGEKINTVRTSMHALLGTALEMRTEYALKKGYSSFYEYQTKRYGYTPEHCDQLGTQFKHSLLPIIESINNELPSSEYYSINVTPPAIQRGFNRAERDKILQAISPEFYNYMKIVEQRNLMDLETREGKSSKMYAARLPESYTQQSETLGFIFLNGEKDDYGRGFFHELGHGFHYNQMSNLDAIFQTPSALSKEIAAITIEYISLYLGAEMRGESLDQFHKDNLYRIAWILTIDEFERWIYTNPDHSIEEREQKFSEIMRSYNPGVTFDDNDPVLNNLWMGQFHILQYPVFYAQYGFARLAALNNLTQFIDNRDEYRIKLMDYLQAGDSVSPENLLAKGGLDIINIESLMQNTGIAIRDSITL